MGLDMYLTAKIHLSFSTRATDHVLTTLSSLFPEVPSIECVSATIGDWRKANAIHAWFVKNVQDGDDDCGTYDVSRSMMADLLDAVDRVLADPSKAPQLLPTSEGFFFGSTEYDEYYIETLRYTKRVIEYAMSEKMNDWYFEYSSSW